MLKVISALLVTSFPSANTWTSFLLTATGLLSATSVDSDTFNLTSILALTFASEIVTEAPSLAVAGYEA